MNTKLELAKEALQLGKEAQKYKNYPLANVCWAIALQATNQQPITRKLHIVTRPGDEIKSFEELISGGFNQLYYALVKLEIEGEGMNVPLPVLGSMFVLSMIPEVESFKIEDRNFEDHVVPEGEISLPRSKEFLDRAHKTLGGISFLYPFNPKVAEGIADYVCEVRDIPRDTYSDL